ncbi:hypothetical protein E1301_Tti022388 [Triplophysa tibetana]|uniref:Uncharacterized protein n=1 Tax=Triplophysa tibetana TaxID=1572043 RepID=A0A5A9NM30_9TELE|nr:hypothetical protein E1301_Tti022388 [Triplophysa tibetana]
MSFRCELCSEQIENVQNHLSDRHRMSNEREMELICCLIKGRQSGPDLICSVPGCTAGKTARLDRHLERVHRVDKAEKKRLIAAARRHAIVDELRKLRAGSPDPPMVSELDLSGTSTGSAAGEQMANVSRMLGTFERESCGPHPSAKRAENARQRTRRTRDFFEFCSRSYGHHFFDTMPPTDALLGYLAVLYGRKLTVSTVRHYLIDVRIFCSYAAESSERDASVSEAKLRHLQRACLHQMNQLRGDVRAHRAEVRASNSGKIIPRESLCKFLSGARRHIPRLMEAFAKAPRLGVMFKLQGFLSGYMSILTGHRRCVLLNMTALEVSRAGTARDGYRVISVKHHKTAAFFGEAKVTLSPLEYSWTTGMISQRSVVSDFVFCTAQGSMCLPLLTHFRAAWRRLRLPEDLGFTVVRNSIITHAHGRLPLRKRECLARALCHNVQTALRYYVADQTDDLARVSRSYALSALGALKTPK